MKYKILVIDDDASLRRVLEYNLQQEGHEVQAVSSGEEGLYYFGQKQPDLVVTDMKMSGMDGMTVLKTIKERSPETLVIIVTAFGDVDAAVAAMKSGAYDFITKPFDRESFLLTINKALRYNGLAKENRRLQNELSDKTGIRSFVWSSAKMEKVFAVIRKVADTEASILVTGESGTGKELVARSLHTSSSRRKAPFVAVNCAAIPRDLLESELFGHVKGSFTGAVKDKTGKFQLADGGTLFLDEIGDLPVELQPKLLRVLQEKSVMPVGGTTEQKLDVRIVAATNLEIETAVANGLFREDLYYRLAVIPIQLPPLRERRDDIPLLLRHFCSRHGTDNLTFDKECLYLLTCYDWPGNVRELENLVERLVIMRNGDVVTGADLPDKIRMRNTPGNSSPGAASIVNLPDGGYSLERLEREVVIQALERNNWNQSAAARFLQIPRHTLIYRVEKYEIGVQ
jgi:two-component system NtrC family response regulator